MDASWQHRFFRRVKSIGINLPIKKRNKEMPLKEKTTSRDKVKVWKYLMEDAHTKESTSTVTLEIPEEAAYLTAQMQDGKVALYFLIDEGEKLERRKFTVVGTGRDLPNEKIHYRETVKLMGDKLIGHVFEFDKQHVTQPTAPKKADTSNARDC